MKNNLWTKKLGPLPVWAWTAIVFVLLLGYLYYRDKKTKATTAAASAANAGDGSATTPPYVNQTYTTVAPPSEPAPRVKFVNNEPTPPPAKPKQPKHKDPVAAKPKHRGGPITIGHPKTPAEMTVPATPNDEAATPGPVVAASPYTALRAG